MINYNKLKYFTVVAKHLNMSNAAKELYIGQPALSVHINDLEKELGIQLFKRTNRNLVLTQEGQILYKEIYELFDNIEYVFQNIKSSNCNNDSIINIGLVGSTFIHRFPIIAKSFENTYPNIKIKIIRFNTTTLEKALQEGTVDIGFNFCFSENELFEQTILECGYYVVALPSSEPLAKKEKIYINELKSFNFALLDRQESKEAHDNLINICLNSGFKPKIVAEFSYIEPLLTMVNIGEAITITSNLAPLENYHNISIVPLANVTKLNFCMIWKKGFNNSAVNLFIDYIRKAIINED